MAVGAIHENKDENGNTQYSTGDDDTAYDAVIVATGHWNSTFKDKARKDVTVPAGDNGALITRLRETVEKEAKRQYQETGQTDDIEINIATLGTSLSAVDAMKTVFANKVGHGYADGDDTIYVEDDDGTELKCKIKLDMVSRHGTLPQVRLGTPATQEFRFSRDGIRRIIQQGHAKEKGDIKLDELVSMVKKDLKGYLRRFSTDRRLNNISWNGGTTPLAAVLGAVLGFSGPILSSLSAAPAAAPAALPAVTTIAATGAVGAVAGPVIGFGVQAAAHRPDSTDQVINRIRELSDELDNVTTFEDLMDFMYQDKDLDTALSRNANARDQSQMNLYDKYIQAELQMYCI